MFSTTVRKVMHTSDMATDPLSGGERASGQCLHGYLRLPLLRASPLPLLITRIFPVLVLSKYFRLCRAPPPAMGAMGSLLGGTPPSGVFAAGELMPMGPIWPSSGASTACQTVCRHRTYRTFIRAIFAGHRTKRPFRSLGFPPLSPRISPNWHPNWHPRPSNSVRIAKGGRSVTAVPPLDQLLPQGRERPVLSSCGIQ